MDQQQGVVAEAVDVTQHRGLVVAIRIVLRTIHVAFGVVGVVHRPVDHRRTGDAAAIGVRPLGQQHQRHVAAVAPAIDADARGIHEWLALQPLDAGELVGDLHAAETPVQRLVEPAPAAAGSAVVEREYDVAALGEQLHGLAAAPVAPASGDRLHRRPAVDQQHCRITLAGVKARRLVHLPVERRAVGRGDRAVLRRGVPVEVGRVGVRGIEAVLDQPGEVPAVCVEQRGLRRLAGAAEAHDHAPRVA